MRRTADCRSICPQGHAIPAATIAANRGGQRCRWRAVAAKAEIQVRAGGLYRLRQSCRRLCSFGHDEGKKKGRANFAPTFLDLPQRRLPVHPWSAVGDKLYE